MTATSDLIESLISYSWDDWQVTRQEARRVIAAIRNDNVPDATIAALDKSGSLIKLFQRVGPPELARSLIASIAGRTTMQRYQARNALIRSLINNPGHPDRQLDLLPHHHLLRHLRRPRRRRWPPGLRRGGRHRVASQAIQGPFSGVGATGVNPTDLPSIAFGDQLAAQQGPGDRHQVQQPARRPGRLPEPAFAARQAEPGTDAGRPADQHAVPRRLSGQPAVAGQGHVRGRAQVRPDAATDRRDHPRRAA